MATIINDGNSGGSSKLPALILILAVAAVTIAIGALSTLPMTRHAADGRVGTSLDADAIRRMIDDRKCKPIEFYVCPPVLQSKAMCYLKSTGTDELWAAIIVGLNEPNRIITGYVAPYFEYWVGANARDGCYLVSRLQ